jgi:hypothetical protein
MHVVNGSLIDFPLRDPKPFLRLFQLGRTDRDSIVLDSISTLPSTSNLSFMLSVSSEQVIGVALQHLPAKLFNPTFFNKLVIVTSSYR